MDRAKRKRRLQVKANPERLETRWLMRASPILAIPVQPLETARDHPETRAHILVLRLSSEIEQRLGHDGLAASPLDLKEQKAEIEQLVPGNVGNWGTLRVLDRLEANGDHQFDQLYQRISTRFDHWAALHPAQARRSGVTALPVGILPAGGAVTITADPPAAGTNATSPVVSSQTQTGTATGGVVWPDGGVNPLVTPIVDPEGVFTNCNCGDTVNQTVPQTNHGAQPGASSGTGSGGPNGGAGSSSTAGGRSASSASYKAGPMDSDSSLTTGEYLQDHPTGYYQIQGVLTGIDFQYSSLDADPYPIVSAFFTVAAGSNPSSITSITASLTVNGVSQGSPVTYDDVSLTTGAAYIVQVQAIYVSSYATGIYPADLTITKYYSGGTSSNHTYDGSLMVVNDSTSPYGAGWSVGGLQQITVGTAGSTLMITDGNEPPEEFTSSNGVNYTGDAADTSTLTYSSSAHTYTRTYTDGTVIVFNSSGQETSIADRNGNTYDYSYVASGAAAGALYTITDPVGLVTTLAYNATTGKLSTVTDPAAAVTTFTFSGNDLASIEDPDGAITSYGYNGSAEITSEENPDHQTATVTYDSFTRMSSETLLGGTGTVSISPAQEVGLVAAGGTTPLEYPANFIGSVKDANNAITSLTFDQLSGVISETDGRGYTTTITRNSEDWPIAVTDPLNRTITYTYDAYGNATEIERPDGSTETILYNDSFGVPTHVVDFNGAVTTYVLNSDGNVTQEIDPDGQSQYFTYNSAGQMLTDTDPLGATVTYTYNSLGRLTSLTEPGTSIATIQYNYDSAGDVTQVTDEVGDTITYTYNQMGQVLTEQNPVQAAAGKDVSFAYDAAGNLVSVTDALGSTTTYSYNARNEVISIEDPLDNRTTFGYSSFAATKRLAVGELRLAA
jgi:YD repeat-containing protein